MVAVLVAQRLSIEACKLRSSGRIETSGLRSMNDKNLALKPLSATHSPKIRRIISG